MKASELYTKMWDIRQDMGGHVHYLVLGVSCDDEGIYGFMQRWKELVAYV